MSLKEFVYTNYISRSITPVFKNEKKGKIMGKFLPGLFIGAAIGFLIAPKKGSELRLELADRYKQLQNKWPGSATPTSDTSTTMNANADQITLPADKLESARPTNSPIGMSETSSPTPITAPEDAKPNTNRPYSKPTTNNPTSSRSNTSYQASGKQSTQNRRRS